jgi:hypothetical protein
MDHDLLSEDDLRQLATRGISAAQARQQIDMLLMPPPPVDLVRPCTAGDGILEIDETEQFRLVSLAEAAALSGRLTKLVPASGAASRMFASLHPAADGVPPMEAARLLDSVGELAFAAKLREAAQRRGLDLDELRRRGDAAAVVDLLLSPDGLGYGSAPKGLILFHQAEEGPRSAFVEHLVEGVPYLRDETGVCRYHFTVSADASPAFLAELEAARPWIGRTFGVRPEVTFSTQDPATDTLALDSSGRPLRASSGELLLRPGGHGALLRNLQACQGDIVLIKNIDNIVPDSGKHLVVWWRKVLTGLAVSLDAERVALAAALDDAEPGDAVIAVAMDLVGRRFGVPGAKAMVAESRGRRVSWLRDRLARPLRVCAMVRNQGEPGGGPFWVRDWQGEISAQIVEGAQVGRDAGQRAILAMSTHFNPVDMVCCLRDHRNRPLQLDRFVDPRTSFVSEKSSGKERIVVLEWPGLWNGSMAGWTTVFVEVPVATFAPVKTVLDLLRPEHKQRSNTQPEPR